MHKGIRQVGNVMPTRTRDNPNQGRVYAVDGISPAINCMGGGGREPMIVEDAGKGRETTREIVAIRGRNPDNPSDRRAGIPVEQRMEKNMRGLCNTVTTVQKDNMLLETENLYMDGHNYNQRKTVHMPEGICRTVMGGGSHAGNEPKVVQRYRVRKLTERECGRLMGFRDHDMDRMLASVSRTQAYKQFGNSIVVNCLAGIFSQLGIKGVKRWNGGLKDTFGSSTGKEEKGCINGTCNRG